jgi:hypothetical protein
MNPAACGDVLALREMFGETLGMRWITSLFAKYDTQSAQIRADFARVGIEPEPFARVFDAIVCHPNYRTIGLYEVNERSFAFTRALLRAHGQEIEEELAGLQTPQRDDGLLPYSISRDVTIFHHVCGTQDPSVYSVIMLFISILAESEDVRRVARGYTRDFPLSVRIDAEKIVRKSLRITCRRQYKKYLRDATVRVNVIAGHCAIDEQIDWIWYCLEKGLSISRAMMYSAVFDSILTNVDSIIGLRGLIGDHTYASILVACIGRHVEAWRDYQCLIRILELMITTNIDLRRILKQCITNSAFLVPSHVQELEALYERTKIRR